MRTNAMRIRCVRWIAVMGLAITGMAAQAAGIAGLWQQVDDKDGQLNSLVRIEIVAGEVQATIVKGYAKPGKTLDPDARCVACPGEFHDKPLMGLRFLWGLKGSDREWDGGQILDPAEGKIYRAKATLSEDASRLTVRGYVGVALFGRNQVWRRYTGTPD